MTAQKELPIETLRELLSYDPETGVLTWKYRELNWFKTESAFKSWNTKYAGKSAFTAFHDEGYKQGRIFNKTYKAHRVGYAIHYGEWPKDQIDHINGNKADNRITNMRAVNNQENSRNSSKRNDNVSGFTGVFWHKQINKWRSKIRADGKDIHLGCFDCKLDAIAARINANKKYGFHPGHGK